jgi:glycosyltransferase involved in cell wall biosynthesis
MRLHVLSLPHTQTTRAYSHCAYTQKVLKFCDMMTAGGYEVILYAGEENEANCKELVTCITEEQRLEWFGPDVNEKLPSITWDPADPWWKLFNDNIIREIGKRRCGPCKDTLCLIAGLSQKPVADQFPEMLPCEFGIGYEGVFSDLRVYESYAWMHYLYGKEAVFRSQSQRPPMDGRFFDCVIPNYFDRNDFELAPKGDYLLFVGRLIQRKGPHIAAMIAEKMGMPLVVAGAGATHVEEGLIRSGEVEIRGDVHYVGVVGPEQRTKLMAGARALLAPTLYIGPFEGVTIEAMLSGTPCLTTDWGVFPETVETGVTGYRFRTLGETEDMLEAAFDLDPASIRERALERYSLEAVFPMYDEFFHRIDKLRRNGWYE